jgi:CDP-diacylglycerol--glycerol-3-phosphate 3-phosphatidyltransferase
MSLRQTATARYFCRFIEKSIIPVLAPVIDSPNQFTIIGLVFAVIVPFGFYVHPVFGLFFIMLSGVADVIDGLVARSRGMGSGFGAFLDSSLDRISDFFYLFGFWVLFWKSEWLIPASILVFLSLLLTFLISYVKAKAEALRSTCDKGFMERGVRTVYLMSWALLLCLFPASSRLVLWSGLALFVLLTLATVIHRIVHIRNRLTDQSGHRSKVLSLH